MRTTATTATTIYPNTNGIIINGFIIIGKPKINGSPILNNAAGKAKTPKALIRFDLEKIITVASGASPVQI